jgi:hypothetical protein
MPVSAAPLAVAQSVAVPADVLSVAALLAAVAPVEGAAAVAAYL